MIRNKRLVYCFVQKFSLAASQLKSLASLSADQFFGSFGNVGLRAHRARKNLYLLQTVLDSLLPDGQPAKIDHSDSFLPAKVLTWKTVFYLKSRPNE